MDAIKEINEKYLLLETEVDKKLERVKREEEKLNKLSAARGHKSAASVAANKMLSYDEARTRNMNLLKSLEMAKARLRSRATFSPVEQILQKAIDNYKRDLQGAPHTPRSARSSGRTADGGVETAAPVKLKSCFSSRTREEFENATQAEEAIYEVLQN